MPKAVDVVPDVGRKRCYGLFIKFTALKSELLQLFAHHKHVVEEQTVGDQEIELDNSALFLPAVLSDDSLSVNLLTSCEECALIRFRGSVSLMGRSTVSPAHGTCKFPPLT